MEAALRVLRYLLWTLPGIGLALALYLCLFPWRRPATGLTERFHVYGNEETECRQ